MIGTGPGRGIALLYVLFAVAMTVLAVVALRSRLPQLVDDSPDATPDDLVGLQALGRAPRDTPATSGSRQAHRADRPSPLRPPDRRIERSHIE
jgi:hypothetical protein